MFVVACHWQSVVSVTGVINQVTAHQAMCILDFVFSTDPRELSVVRHSWCLAAVTSGELVEGKPAFSGNLSTCQHSANVDKVSFGKNCFIEAHKFGVKV